MGTVDHNARRWERLEELFEQAVELPRESQPAFVERETASDPDLRRQLFDLLEHDTSAGSRIAQAIDSAAGAAATPIEWTGRRFGMMRLPLAPMQS